MLLEKVQPVSMVDHAGNQLIDLQIQSDMLFHGCFCAVSLQSGKTIAKAELAVRRGRNHCMVRLPAPGAAQDVLWQVCGRDGTELCSLPGTWKEPRKWKLYFMVSSHTDIGLHNSQYIQRFNSSRFLDMAMELCDRTASRPANDQYHYIMEGTWFWNNYPSDRGMEKARHVVRDYIRPGKIGICTGVAGNHTQTFGLEEMCRAAFERRRTLQAWGIDSHTMSMIDNNGMSWALVQPFAEAGYRNIIFAPNQWNPLNSRVWHMNTEIPGATWNPQAGGGGAYIDLRFDSALPQVFYWRSADEKHKLLIWAGGNYGFGSEVFGFSYNSQPGAITLGRMEDCTARQLPVMEEKYPYDVWFCASYQDDQEPDLCLTDCIAEWNAHWAWPQMAVCGNPDLPFEELRNHSENDIPVIQGEITGGWYQHPVSTAELLARKFDADRRLPTAEKLSSLACLTDPDAAYPAMAFRRAWDSLLWNDEHSYGTSGYQGRRVYETWMQHRDWIEKAGATADRAIENAMRSLAAHTAGQPGDILIFNPTGLERNEWVRLQDGRAARIQGIPGFGYTVVPADSFRALPTTSRTAEEPPVIENTFYRIAFSDNGSIASILDLETGHELVDSTCSFGANAFVYTTDNHESFSAAERAVFTVDYAQAGITVTARMQHRASGAELVQSVFLPALEKRIEIDNHVFHAKDMFNSHRYYRYAYYAFPWSMTCARRSVHLNGCVAEYARDITGHGTDTYMACNEWCCAEENGLGIGVIQLDSELVEYDHIHPDKTDLGDTGDGGGMYFYLANDWLQMHTSGGSMLNFRFRYVITSYRGTWQEAGLPMLAERIANPVLCTPVTGSSSVLPGRHSFASTAPGVRIINLKMAEDGNGLIARLYSLNRQESPGLLWPGQTVERNTVDEQPLQEGAWQGFETLRIGADRIRLSVREIRESPQTGAARHVIGSRYTGLIDHPRAARGEHEGHLYLEWGACTSEDLAGYLVYRGLSPDFTPDETTLAAKVSPECYVVARYSDEGLLPDTCYYYRVCTIDQAGNHGPLSEVFSGRTKEKVT